MIQCKKGAVYVAAGNNEIQLRIQDGAFEATARLSPQQVERLYFQLRQHYLRMVVPPKKTWIQKLREKVR